MSNKLDLIVDKDCTVCKRAEYELTVFTSENSNMEMTVSLVGSPEYSKILIVPALILDGKLFCYGEIDFRKLKKRLKN